MPPSEVRRQGPSRDRRAAVARAQVLVDRRTDRDDDVLGRPPRHRARRRRATSIQSLLEERLGAVLDERHRARADRALPAFVRVEKPDGAARSREHDPERQPDVAAAADDDDIVPLGPRWIVALAAVRRDRGTEPISLWRRSRHGPPTLRRGSRDETLEWVATLSLRTDVAGRGEYALRSMTCRSSRRTSVSGSGYHFEIGEHSIVDDDYYFIDMRSHRRLTHIATGRRSRVGAEPTVLHLGSFLEPLRRCPRVVYVPIILSMM